MGLAQLGAEIFLLFVAGALATIGTLVWRFVIGAASDEREQNSEDIADLKERVKNNERACAKAERLEPRVDAVEQRTEQTQADLEELMRYLLGTDQPGDRGAIRGMHDSIEDVRGDVRDLNEQNKKISREVTSIGRTHTEIAFSIQELADAVQQIDGVETPDIQIRDEYNDSNHRPDGGAGLGTGTGMGSHKDVSDLLNDVGFPTDNLDDDFHRGGDRTDESSIDLPDRLERRVRDLQEPTDTEEGE